MSERSSKRVSKGTKTSASKKPAATRAKKTAAKTKAVAKKTTTKKSAAKKTTRTKTTAAKKTAAKKSSTKKAATKAKKPTAATKQTAEKAPTTNAKTEKSARKPASKKSAATTAKANSPLTSETQNTTKNAAKGDVSIDTSHHIGVADEQVTIFSRVKTGTTVLLVARVLGLVLVAAGALCSMIGLNRAYDTGLAETAFNTIDHSLTAALVTVLDPTISPEADDSQLLDRTAATQLTVDFKLPSSPVHGLVTLKFSVPARSVNVRLFSQADNRDIDLGNAKSSDGMAWSKDWDTTKYLNGDYYVKVDVTDASGHTYQFSAPHPVIVEHEDHTDPTTDTTAADTTTTSDSSESSKTISSLSDVNFHLDTSVPSTVTEPVTVRFSAQDIAYARVQFKDVQTGKVFPATNVTEVTLGKWQFTLDPATLPPATYGLGVQLETATGMVVGNQIDRFEVPANITTVATTTTDTDPAANTTTGAETSTTTVKKAGETVDETRDISSTDTSKQDGQTVVEPQSTLHVPSSELTGQVSIFVETEGASQTEIYLRPKDSLKDIFVGIAQFNGEQWRLVWNTAQTPNGEYKLFAKHKNQYGYYYSNYVSVRIKNEFAGDMPVKDTEYKTNLTEAAKTVDAVYTDMVGEEPAEDLDSTDEVQVDQAVASLLDDFKDEVHSAIRAYMSALQSGDEERIAKTKADLLTIREKITEIAKKDDRLAPLAAQINDVLAQKINRLLQNVEKTEQVVRERVGDAATKDTDGDSITDYDEVALYNTDPFSADTDGDGYNDDVEILGGFDPTSAAVETPVVFESPKEVGVVRDDLLKVSGVVKEAPPAPTDGSEASPTNTAAIITGRALPNSFVTLYIYSTPVIVTVRTNDDGTWSYRFEKELEDGEHEVYVGVTDNAGKIVAKSNPFKFVKEAEAFTPVDAEAAVLSTDVAEPTLFNNSALFIALGGVIVSFGFVLLLISFYIGRRNMHEPNLVAHVG